MNQQLIKINENLGAVSDEHGNIKLIDKTTNTYSFQEILEIENEIEVNDIKLNNSEEEIQKISHRINTHKANNMIVLMLTIYLLFNLNIASVIIYLIFLLCLEVPTHVIYGSLKKLQKQLAEVQKLKIETATNQEVLKKNLQIMQRKVQYHDYNSQNNLTYMTDFNNEQNHNNIQVLSLKRSKRY